VRNLKLIKDIHLGNQTISIKGNDKGLMRAEITDVWGGPITFEKRDEKLRVLINESHTDVPIQHLAIVLHELGFGETIINKLSEMKK
jgi:hypothetical protein